MQSLFLESFAKIYYANVTTSIVPFFGLKNHLLRITLCGFFFFFFFCFFVFFLVFFVFVFSYIVVIILGGSVFISMLVNVCTCGYLVSFVLDHSFLLFVILYFDSWF
jgi:hypothetical protein